MCVATNVWKWIFRLIFHDNSKTFSLLDYLLCRFIFMSLLFSKHLIYLFHTFFFCVWNFAYFFFFIHFKFSFATSIPNIYTSKFKHTQNIQKRGEKLMFVFFLFALNLSCWKDFVSYNGKSKRLRPMQKKKQDRCANATIKCRAFMVHTASFTHFQFASLR